MMVIFDNGYGDGQSLMLPVVEASAAFEASDAQKNNSKPLI